MNRSTALKLLATALIYPAVKANEKMLTSTTLDAKTIAELMAPKNYNISLDLIASVSVCYKDREVRFTNEQLMAALEGGK